MKLRNLLFLAVATVLTFTACSSDKDEPTPAVGITAATITPAGSSVVYNLATNGQEGLDNSADPVAWDVTDAAMAQSLLKVTPTLNTTIKYNGEPIPESGVIVDATKPILVHAINGNITKEINIIVVRASEAAEGLTKKATLDAANVIWRDFVYFKGKFYTFFVKNTITNAETGEALEEYLLKSSTDGVTWTDVNYTIDVEEEVLAGEGAHLAVFKDKLFVLTGQRVRGEDKYGNPIEADNWGWGPLYAIYKWREYVSTDGVNFNSLEAGAYLYKDEQQTPMIASYNNPFSNVFVFKDKLCSQGGYMWGFGQQQTARNFICSADGLQWEIVPITFTNVNEISLPNDAAIFELGGKLFCMGGYRNFISSNNICSSVYTSEDLLAWTEVAQAATGIPALYQAKVVSNGSVAYLFGGEYLDGETRVINSKVYRSENGINWTEVAVPSSYAGTRFPQALLVGKAIWLFDGDASISTGNYPAPAGNEDVFSGNVWNTMIK